MLIQIILAALPALTLAVSPVVNVTYRSYRGVPLSNGVTQWLGMRYAQPPNGTLRFKAPVAPPVLNQIDDASATQPYCLGLNSAPSAKSDEDCLFLNLFAPTSATTTSKLPVYIFIQSGGYNYNSNPNYNGSQLVTRSGKSIIVVNFNYRVGPYGFLAGAEIAANGNHNNGLLDQRFLMQWVQQHITQFGGDPGHVTLGGASAGAQSVTLHLTNYGGRDDGLFQATAAESQGMSSLRTIAESQFMYDNFTNHNGCQGSANTFTCLQGRTQAQLAAVNYNVPFPGRPGNPLYMYGPTLDFDMITDYTYDAFRKGNYIKLPAIWGDDTNEGTNFAPKTAASQDAVNTFMANNFPNLTTTQLAQLDTLYPAPASSPYSAWTVNGIQAAAMYGELRYICPGLFLSSTYANTSSNPAWNYHWNVIDPSSNASGSGVYHTVEVNAIWGPDNTNNAAPSSYYSTGVNGAIVPFVQAYWISFIRSFNPNKYRLTASPTWDAWNVTNQNMRYKFETSANVMEAVPSDQLARCRYLWSIGPSLAQ